MFCCSLHCKCWWSIIILLLFKLVVNIYMVNGLFFCFFSCSWWWWSSLSPNHLCTFPKINQEAYCYIISWCYNIKITISSLILKRWSMPSSHMCVQCLFFFPWNSCYSKNESQLLFVYFLFAFQTNWWWRKDELCFKDLDVQELENVKASRHYCNIHSEIWVANAFNAWWKHKEYFIIDCRITWFWTKVTCQLSSKKFATSGEKEWQTLSLY